MQKHLSGKGNNIRRQFMEEVIGQIVMTDYNKKTYRIDDVTWEQNPTSTFRMKDENISYIDYYQKVN